MTIRLVLGVMAAGLLAASAMPAAASQLVYKPVNPSFGGDPLNGSWLLQSASAQSADAGGAGGFSIDFPDFGGIPQPDPDDTDLPPVDTTGGTTPSN